MPTETELTPVVTEPIVETPIVVEPVPTPTIETVITETPIVDPDETPEIFLSPESIITKIDSFFNSWTVMVPSAIFLVVCLYYFFIK